MRRLLIIGGSDAGVSAALRAREIAPRADVTVLVADRYPNYSICGLPFRLSREVESWNSLAHREPSEHEATGARFVLNTKARAVDLLKRVVTSEGPDGSRSWPFDSLVVATGAIPATPPIDGLDLDGVFSLHTMDSGRDVDNYVSGASVTSVVIVGGGYIGIEMADAFTHRGIKVTLVGKEPTVLPTVDAAIGNRLAGEMQAQGVDVVAPVTVQRIERDGRTLTVHGNNGFRRSADMVLVAAGVKPATTLGSEVGMATGPSGAFVVDREMRTNLAEVWAAGDCVETWHRVLQEYRYLPLGTTAHKQGRIAGENAVGGNRCFEGVVGTQVVKVFSLAVARTGLLETEANAAGFVSLTTTTVAYDHKHYYPDAHPLTVRITGDRVTGRLLGTQIIGHWKGEIAKRIDVCAALLHQREMVQSLLDLDLSYTPPLGTPWDALQIAAQDWLKAVRLSDMSR